MTTQIEVLVPPPTGQVTCPPSGRYRSYPWAHGRVYLNENGTVDVRFHASAERVYTAFRALHGGQPLQRRSRELTLRYGRI